MRQLIVNACSLSDVAFTLLVSFRGLAVSPRTSFERLTLYHSRVIKQAVIFRVVLRSRPDLRCIKSHCGSFLPYFADIFCSMCTGFAAACLFIAGLLTSASLQGQAREVRILPVFSSSVAFQKNLRTSELRQKVFRDGSRRREQQIIFRADCAIADSNRRYVRIRFHFRPVFLERVSKSPGHRPSKTSSSI